VSLLHIEWSRSVSPVLPPTRSARHSHYDSGMMEHRLAVVAWSSGVTAGAIAAAALFATPEKHPFSNPWVILFVVIGAVAFLLLVVAGIPDVAA
jgi:hypothetical protein